MQADIIAKLKGHLSQPIETEPTALYLLAEIRKVLDPMPHKSRPLPLYLHCCWALHVDLTQERTTGPFLKRVDDYVGTTVAGLTSNVPHSFLGEHSLFREFLYLDTLRNEMRGFFEAHGLPLDLCDDDKRWFAFLKAYGGIIEDGSLSARDDSGSLQSVVRVTFMKGRPLPPELNIPLSVQWEILLKDNRIVTVDIEPIETMEKGAWAFSFGVTVLPDPSKPTI